MTDHKESSSSPGQVRLMMLTLPRTASTALTKCLSFVDRSLVAFEPYAFEYIYGPDRVFLTHPDERLEQQFADTMEYTHQRVLDLPEFACGKSQHGYRWVTDQLEAPHPDKDFILCKDVAYAFKSREEFLPRGYRYVVLIRHPLKVFPSWKRVLVPMSGDRPLDELHPSLMPAGYGFRELSSMLDRVRSTGLDPEPIVIDADDLLARPGPVLAALFQRLGLPFRDSLLSWEAGEAVARSWMAPDIVWFAIKYGEVYTNAVNSTGFLEPGDLPDRSSLPPDILQCVDASMPYYEKMYAQRLKPE